MSPVHVNSHHVKSRKNWMTIISTRMIAKPLVLAAEHSIGSKEARKWQGSSGRPAWTIPWVIFIISFRFTQPFLETIEGSNGIFEKHHINGKRANKNLKKPAKQQVRRYHYVAFICGRISILCGCYIDFGKMRHQKDGFHSGYSGADNGGFDFFHECLLKNLGV